MRTTGQLDPLSEGIQTSEQGDTNQEHEHKSFRALTHLSKILPVLNKVHFQSKYIILVDEGKFPFSEKFSVGKCRRNNGVRKKHFADRF